MALTDFDSRSSAIYPVARWQQDYPIAVSGAGATISGSAATGAITDINGMAKQIHLKVPDLELAGSGNAIFKDMDGNIIYETGSQAAATITVLSGDFIPFFSPMSVFITTTGSPATGDGSVWLTVYYV